MNRGKGNSTCNENNLKITLLSKKKRKSLEKKILDISLEIPTMYRMEKFCNVKYLWHCIGTELIMFYSCSNFVYFFRIICKSIMQFNCGLILQ